LPYNIKEIHIIGNTFEGALYPREGHRETYIHSEKTQLRDNKPN